MSKMTDEVSERGINADAEIRAKLHIEFDVECQSVDTYVDGWDEITLFAKGEDGNHVDLLVPPSEDNGQLFRRRFHVIVEEAGEGQA